MSRRSLASLLAVVAPLLACSQHTAPLDASGLINARGGGAVTLGDELTLMVPAGSLQQDTVIGVSRLQNEARRQAYGFTTTAQAYELSPHGTIFSLRTPAVLTVRLDQADLLARGLDPSTARIFYVDPEGGDYVSVASAFDPARGNVVAAVEHFSKYVVLAQAAAASSPGPTVLPQSTVPATIRADAPILLRATVMPTPGTSIVSVRVRYEKRPFGPSPILDPAVNPNAVIASMVPDQTPSMPGANSYQLLVPAAYLKAADLGGGSDFRYLFEATDSLGVTSPVTPAIVIPRNVTASYAPGTLALNPPSLTISAGFESWISLTGLDGGGTPFQMIAESLAVSACPDGRAVGSAGNQLASGVHFAAEAVCAGSVSVTSGGNTVPLPVNVSAGPMAGINLYRYEQSGLSEIRTLFDGTYTLEEGTVLDFDALGYDADGNGVLVNVNWQAQPTLGTIDGAGRLYALDGAGLGTVTAQVGSFGPMAVQWLNVIGRSWFTRGLDLNVGNPQAAWVSGGSMSTGKSGHTATRLLDDRVLVTGGTSNGSDQLSVTQLYNPATNSWVTTGTMSPARDYHGATALPDGKVLVVGGHQLLTYGFLTPVQYDASLSASELYNSATNSWSHTSNLNQSRREPGVTPLPGGKVLVTGGVNDAPTCVTICTPFCEDECFTNTSALSSAEVYDSAAGTWTTRPSMSQPRFEHQATAMSDGRVLVTGGRNLSGAPTGAAEIFNPVTGTWSPAGVMSVARRQHSATLLPNGKVLVAGGRNGAGAVVAAAEIYDPATNGWLNTGPMGAGRANHQAILMPSGKVLVTGGSGPSSNLSSTETYDPATGLWTGAPAMTGARTGHTATVLASGRILVAGGALLSSAEVYLASEPAPVPSLAMAGPTPYLAWHEPSAVANHVYVKHWNGTAWVQDGSGPLNVDPSREATYPQLAFASSVPTVAWQEQNGAATQIYVKQWNGAGWVQPAAVSLNLDSTRNARRPAIAVSGATPYVAWSEVGAGGSSIHVRRWNAMSATWPLLGGSLNVSPAAIADSPSIAVIAGVPYVAWREAAGVNGQIFVKHWAGTGWVQDGLPLNASPTSDASEPVLGVSGATPYVAWREQEAGVSQIRVAHWNGAAWVQDGPGLANDPTQSLSRPALGFFNGTPYAAWSEGAGGIQQLIVKHLNAGTWRQNGAGLNVGLADSFSPSIAFDGPTPLVSWAEASGSIYGLHVKALE